MGSTLLVKSRTHSASDCDINLQALHAACSIGSPSVYKYTSPQLSIKEMKDRLRNEGRPEQISYTFEKGGTPAVAQWTCTYWMDGNRVESGEPKTKKKAAKLSAARRSLPILKRWLGYY
ncbi:hypothetical protein FRC18_011245 [Serendipita sp. 400]|nr:hypothetical protein FRC18_011245 [Serendipita sp. 400]